ncbi:MAG TPA: hypothetical protein VF045_07335 [Acidimicrobiales bacterium]
MEGGDDPLHFRFSHALVRETLYDGLSGLRRALNLLQALPHSEERDRHERWAQARLGVLLGWTRGQGSPEATRAFARARELCEAASDSAEELPALYGLYVASLFVPDLDRALGYAQQLLEAGERHRDPRYSLAGHLAFGMPLFQQGELGASLQHSQRATVLATHWASRGWPTCSRASPGR